ncbi:unnamed protein product [Rotaria magnacalcarata]|uniref:Uncharacterized protein n=1 Tax=Rotaria magnacalcarata TaxID=392030 RepID=A0A816PXC9_9BILA|nr:unnamed protein product [Rotaria magnacalcarata]
MEVPTYVSDDEMDTSETEHNGNKKRVKKRQRNWVEKMVFNNIEEAEETAIKEDQWSYHYTNTTAAGKINFIDVIKSKLVSTKLGPTSISLGEIEEWCLESSQSIPESDDAPFVASYQIIYDDGDNENEDDDDDDINENKHFHLFGMAIRSNETTQGFRFIFRALQEGMKKLNLEEIDPDFFNC